MEENNSNNWIIATLVGALIWVFFFHKDTYEGQTAEEWFNEYDYEIARSEELESKLSEYQDALEEANSEIDEAKYYTWESYEEIGEALENLDTISEP